jgi:hypothetical protein
MKATTISMTYIIYYRKYFSFLSWCTEKSKIPYCIKALAGTANKGDQTANPSIQDPALSTHRSAAP